MADLVLGNVDAALSEAKTLSSWSLHFHGRQRRSKHMIVTIAIKKNKVS